MFVLALLTIFKTYFKTFFYKIATSHKFRYISGTNLITYLILKNNIM